MFGPKSSSQETEQNPRPHQGAIKFFLTTPFALRQVTGRQQVYENPCECEYCVLRCVYVALSIVCVICALV